MSSNEDGGQQQGGEQDKEQDQESIFQFFSQFTKPLLLELPSSEDRAMAALWIRRLEAEPQTEEEKRLRTDYLKLLLFVMQRGRLLGIFKKEPPSGPLEPFRQGFGLTEMGNFLLEQAELQGSGDAEGRVSYSVEISNDLKEFVAAQEIPDFGVQVYYAWSVEDPIHKWASFDETKFPHHVRDKIRKLKIVKSEEKTNLKSDSLHGEKTESSLRKCHDSQIYDKSKAKVKSPEEIEKSLERNYQTFSSYSRVKGSVRGKSSADVTLSRKSRNNSDILSEMSQVRGHWSNAAGAEEEDFTGGIRIGRSSPCPSQSAARQKPATCHGQQSKRNHDADTSKRLQKCDGAVENGSGHMNQQVAGPSRRSCDKNKGKEMYSEWVKYGREAAPPERTPYSSARELQMNQAASQPAMKSRKNKCSAQGNQSQEEVQNKKCVYSCQHKGSHAYGTGNCNCPCPRAEEGFSQKEVPCFKKKEKSQTEKPCPKAKPPCPEYMKKGQEQACHAAEEAMKSYQKKLPLEHPEGCICHIDRRKQQIEYLSRIGQNKAAKDTCPPVVPQQQEYACSKKRDKRAETKVDTLPEYFNKSQTSDCYKKAQDKNLNAFYEMCEAQAKLHANANAPFCQQGKRAKDTSRVYNNAYPGGFHANAAASCSKNQDPRNRMQGHPAREGMYPDKRCEQGAKDFKYPQKRNQEYPCNNALPCPSRRGFQSNTFPLMENQAIGRCTCGIRCQNQNVEEDLGDNASCDSDENPPEDSEGQDDSMDTDNNLEDSTNNTGNAESSSSPVNLTYEIIDLVDTSDETEYAKLPTQIRNCSGINETQNRYPTPGREFCSGGEQLFPRPTGQAPCMSPFSRQIYQNQRCMQPCSGKSPGRPREPPRAKYVNPHHNDRNFIASTPEGEGGCTTPFSCGSISTVPHYLRSRNETKWDNGFIDNETLPFSAINQNVKTFSSNVECAPEKRKQTFQELQCSQQTQGSSGQPHFISMQDASDNADMAQMTQCSPIGNFTDKNYISQSQRMNAQNCCHPRSF